MYDKTQTFCDLVAEDALVLYDFVTLDWITYPKFTVNWWDYLVWHLVWGTRTSFDDFTHRRNGYTGTHIWPHTMESTDCKKQLGRRAWRRRYETLLYVAAIPGAAFPRAPRNISAENMCYVLLLYSPGTERPNSVIEILAERGVQSKYKVCEPLFISTLMKIRNLVNHVL